MGEAPSTEQWTVLTRLRSDFGMAVAAKHQDFILVQTAAPFPLSRSCAAASTRPAAAAGHLCVAPRTLTTASAANWVLESVPSGASTSKLHVALLRRSSAAVWASVDSHAPMNLHAHSGPGASCAIPHALAVRCLVT